MKQKRRGSQQGQVQNRRSRDRAKSLRRRQIRRATLATPSDSPRRQVAGRTRQPVGKLDAESAFKAVRDMGIAVDSQGNADTAAARKVAEGAAISAARALGVEIRKADGSIDTAKARQAISQMLGFSIERDGAAEQGAAVARSQQAAEAAAQSILTTARALGANPDNLEGQLRDTDGNIDTAKAARITEISLNLDVAEQRTLGRREALDTLNISLDAATTDNPLSRRAASDAIEKLQKSSVLVDGKIDRRQALKALEEKLSKDRFSSA
ncbi:MAG: hypothetical protein AAFQ74_19590 [Cyanobacteria bacterium J06623_4]